MNRIKNRIPAVIRMHASEKISWFYIPWIILFASFAVNLLSGLLLNRDSPIISGSSASLSIFLFVAGMVGVAQTFSFAIGLSVRRSDYFWGTAAMAGIVCLVHALVLTVMALMEKMSDSWGGTVAFFHLPYMNDGSFPEQLWVYLALLLHSFFSGLLIISLYRRYGGYVLTAVLCLLFLLVCAAVLLASYYMVWEKMYTSVTRHPASFHALLSALLTAFYAFLSNRFLRRAV